MANIITRLGAFRNKAIVHTVDSPEGPQDFRFYPPRMRMLISGRMKEIIEPLTSAMAVLFSSTGQDASRQQEVESDGRVTTFVQGLSPEVIELRERKRREAIERAMGVLLNDSTRYQIGELLADSMRDEFSDKESERAKEARQFMDEVDFPTIVSLIRGYLKALAPILDASGNSILSGLQETVKREVARAVRKTEAGEDAQSGHGSVLQMPGTMADRPSGQSD